MSNLVSTDHEKQHIFGQLGVINDYQGSYRDAILLYKKSINIQKS